MKQIVALLIAMFSCNFGYACGVCGSSAGTQFLGLLPQSRQNFVGIQYQHRGFVSEHPGHGEHGSSAFSNEKYNSVQAWGRYYINSRIQVFAFVPYISNIKSENAGRSVVSGLGDIMIMGNANLIIPSQTADWKHQLHAGVGVKMPTGAYDSKAISQEEGLPNMQPGTRSWDFSVNANYTLRKERMGLNVEGAYTITTANDYDYRYGNKLSAGLLAFHQLKQKALTLLPQAGVKADVTGADYDRYTYKWRNDMTGGQQLYAVAGIQVYYSKIGLQASYYHPIYQHFANGLVNVKYKIETGISFLF